MPTRSISRSGPMRIAGRLDRRVDRLDTRLAGLEHAQRLERERPIDAVDDEARRVGADHGRLAEPLGECHRRLDHRAAVVRPCHDLDERHQRRGVEEVQAQRPAREVASPRRCAATDSALVLVASGTSGRGFMSSWRKIARLSGRSSSAASTMRSASAAMVSRPRTSRSAARNAWRSPGPRRPSVDPPFERHEDASRPRWMAAASTSWSSTRWPASGPPARCPRPWSLHQPRRRPCGRLVRHQVPVNRGGRFARNAATPSA